MSSGPGFWVFMWQLLPEWPPLLPFCRMAAGSSSSIFWPSAVLRLTLIKHMPVSPKPHSVTGEAWWPGGLRFGLHILPLVLELEVPPRPHGLALRKGADSQRNSGALARIGELRWQILEVYRSWCIGREGSYSLHLSYVICPKLKSDNLSGSAHLLYVWLRD